VLRRRSGIKVSTEPAAIRSALEGYADHLERVVVDASSLGIWLYRELQPAGLPIIFVDRNDARGIAQMMWLDCPRQEYRDAEDALAAGQQEAPQAQADRHRESHCVARCERMGC
jgi:hypothetical protein